MAELRFLSGDGATGRVIRARTGQVLFHAEPGFRTTSNADPMLRVLCDFEKGTRLGRMTVIDGDGNLEIYGPVHSMVPVLEEALTRFRARRDEIDATLARGETEEPDDDDEWWHRRAR